MSTESTILVLSGKSDETEELARILADQFRVVEAENLADGIAHLSNGVAVVVADLETAGSSALEMLRRTKEERAETPILVVANGGDVNAAVEAMKLGAADCLVKPVKPDELQEAVSELAERSRVSEPGSNSDRPSSSIPHIDIPPGTSLEDLERAAVEQALAQHHGNRTHAAKTLGISVRTLQRKLKAWGIPILGTPPSSRANPGPRTGNHFVLSSPGGHSAYSSPVHSAH
jgi:DNA-binding NtrC family response regulator